MNNNEPQDIRALKVHAEQVGLLYQLFPTSVIATLVGAVLLISSQWSITEHTLLLGWLLIITTVTALRALLPYFYKRNLYDITESKRWGHLFIAGLFVAGATWGIGGALLFPKDSLLHQVLIIFILMSISSGAVTSVSAMRGALLFFIVPALLPIVPLFIIEKSELSNLIAMMVLLAFGFYMKGSSNIYRSIKENINLRLSAEENEQKLHIKSRQLQNIISCAPIVLWSHDKNGIFTLSDGKGLDAIGLKPGEVVGQSVFEFYAAYPNVISDMRRALAGESFSRERLVGERWYESHYIPYFDSQGKPNGCIGVAMDTTNRKKAEIELIVAKEQAEKASLVKSEFLASMSHELRTPMNAILGFGQLIEMDAKDEKTKDNIQEIINAGGYLLELINQVLDLSKIESGNVSISINSHSLNDLLYDCLSKINPVAAKQSIAIDNKVDPSLNIRVNVDEGLFKQVLLNLLSNAIKYNGENGKVTIDCSSNDKKMLSLSVSDTGKGLTPEQKNHLFKPFDRAGAEGSNIPGTGLGLVISKDLIEKMNGTIDFESEIGKGSRFWIQVPIS